MNIDLPNKFKPIINNARQVALNVYRPMSRKYGRAEHQEAKELEMLAAVLDGFNEGDPSNSAGATQASKGKSNNEGQVINGANMSTCLGVMELCYGEVGFLLAMPRQGLGNAAIAAVANDEQLERFKGRWAAMAITEPGCCCDTAAIRTTAIQDGDHYVLNGEKIVVTSGERADSVVVWASVDAKVGSA